MNRRRCWTPACSLNKQPDCTHLWRGLVGANDFQQRHEVRGAEEVCADDAVRRLQQDARLKFTVSHCNHFQMCLVSWGWQGWRDTISRSPMAQQDDTWHRLPNIHTPCGQTEAACTWVLAPTSSMLMVEVLVDRMASFRHAFSRSAKICCLIFRFCSMQAARGQQPSRRSVGQGKRSPDPQRSAA